MFVSYSHSDDALYGRLAKHLKPLEYEGIIRPWSDHRITAGKDFGAEVLSALERANVILLLISADFIASEYCWGIEMKRAIERHNGGTARVVPIILRPVDWHRSPFGQLHALPRNGKAITSWPNEDEALLDVAKSIRLMALELVSQRVNDDLPQEKPPLGADQSGKSLEAVITLSRANTPVKSFGKSQKRPAYKVFLDDTLKTQIEAGETISLSVPPGHHHIQVRLKWRRSERLFFRADAKEQLFLECGSKGIDAETSVMELFSSIYGFSSPYYLKRRVP